ncbi:MAG: hypothetical protein DRQ01_01380 [Ignavibacteriae bacterium]|nr:MAG: hypothetical protein DRQ01_01380 [Ignavibacteriota bacterium]
MVQYTRGSYNKVLTFNPFQISFIRETVLNKPDTTMKDDVQSQFQLLIFITLLALLLLSFSTRAQINAGGNLDNVEISFVVTKLQNKVLLNDSQVTFVKQLLQKYSVDLAKYHNSEPSSKNTTKQNLLNDTNQQIESVLDSRQKMKYEIIENEWWSLVKHEEKD